MPSLEPVSRAHTENPSHQRCHLSGARDQSSCHSCTQLLDVPEVLAQDCNRVVFELIQFGNFSQLRTTLSTATGLPHSPPSETQSHRSRVGFHRTAAASVSRCGPELDTAVVVRGKRSRSTLYSVCTWPFTASSSVSRTTKLMKYDNGCDLLLTSAMKWSCGIDRSLWNQAHVTDTDHKRISVKHSNFHKTDSKLGSTNSCPTENAK